jgi:hypothetical protein
MTNPTCKTYESGKMRLTKKYRMNDGCLQAAAAVWGLVVVASVTLVVLAESGHLLPAEVTRGEGTPARHLERLREIGALAPEEEVLLFYSWGLFDAAEGGAALTDEGVVAWFEHPAQEGRHEIDRAPYAAIMGARVAEQGSLLIDTTIEVETPLALHFVTVSAEAGGDAEFLERLVAEWERRGGHRPDAVPSWYAEQLDD